MAALLTVYQNHTEKVTLYASECRQMGIEVLAPDVNHSCWAFTIEDDPSEKSCIRFGLGAIKNVGEGPVDEIIQGRGETSFLDINDFLQRVDLRKVGKRALESLIQVGALDNLGNRPSLLESMDRILAISSSIFQAADAGQISMFGNGSSLTESIKLSEAKIPISRRVQLDWERELIGLYVSDHPLSTVMDSLKQHVSHFAQDLNEAKHQERVSVAGIVTKIRQHQTKNGKQMAFATIEDIQGLIDLVIFPNTWKKFGELIRFDELIYVRGKADANGGETKVLVDHVATELSHLEPIKETSHQSPPPPVEVPPPTLEPLPDLPFPEAESSQIPEDPAEYIPPPPESFPPDMEGEPAADPAPEDPPPPEEQVITREERPGSFTLEEDATYLVTVIIKNQGDTMRDKLRLRQVYGTLISYPGKDRFVFQIIENDISHLLEFPNASTKISKILMNQLRDMVGRDNVQIEKYLF
jgi:DNA polymerase-3 subunit alpha